MNSERIKEIIDKIPLTLFTFIYLAYLAYQYYDFTSDPASPLVAQKKVYESAKENNAKLAVKLKETQEFVKTLEAKKVELRQLAQELQNVKGIISEKLDIPNFMKMIVTEAKKVGISVSSLKPAGVTNREEYSEQLFIMSYKGVFVQVLAFFDRLANVTEIVRLEDFSLTAQGSPQARFVEVSGTIQIKAYKYRGSKADSIGNNDQPLPPPGVVPPAGGGK